MIADRFPPIPRLPETPRYGLYARITSRTRRRQLVAIMFDREAAEIYADELCAAKGYTSVEVVPEADAPGLPASIPA